VTFTATLDSSFPAGTTTLPNAVVVVGTGSNCTPQANQDADCNTTTTVEAHPSIHAEKTVDGEHITTAVPGQVLHYAITVTNSGDAAGTADISDDVTAIQAHATINAASISDGGTLTAGTITWPQFTLAANGGTKTVTFTATLDSTFPAGTTTIPNAVVVVGPGSNCPDLTQNDLAAAVIDPDCQTTTTVSGHASIHAVKTVDGEHVTLAQPGNTLHYAITVTNSGDGAGTADISDDVTALLAHGTIGNISDGGTLLAGKITWPQFILAGGGGTKTVTFTATLSSTFPAGTTTLPNAVVVVGQGSNCAPQANQAADCNTVTTVKVIIITPPPTDTFESTGPANPGSSMALILAALATLILGISFVTPVPAVVRRRNRR
jgi:uncharacterized repeat protein (TIGR01451 family)